MQRTDLLVLSKGHIFFKWYNSFYCIPHYFYFIQQWNTEMENTRIVISKNVTLKKTLPSLKTPYWNVLETNISSNPVRSPPYHTNHTDKAVTCIAWLGLSKAVLLKSPGQFACLRLSGWISVYRPQATESSCVHPNSSSAIVHDSWDRLW